MRCEDARELLSTARYGAELPEPAAQHLDTCAACRAAQAEQRELDAFLASDEPGTPGPGFDTRFFARLGEERARTRRRRWARLGFALLPVAAAIALVVLRRTEPPSDRAEPLPGVAHEDLDLAVDLELVEELEVVEHMEELETFDELSGVDEHELEALLEDAP